MKFTAASRGSPCDSAAFLLYYAVSILSVFFLLWFAKLILI